METSTFLDITEVWDQKRAAMECNEGQIHLWDYYTRVAQQRANHFKRNSGGQAGDVIANMQKVPIHLSANC